MPHPEQTDLVKRYYQVKASNPQAAKDFFKANADALSNDFDSYKSARLKEINGKRAIEGHSPIDEDTFNNVTFGFESDQKKVFNELKYGKGFGGSGGFRGSGGPGGGTGNTGSALKYAVSLNAGGKVAKPTVSVRDQGSPKSKAKKTAKAKVTLKKSRV